VNVVGELQPKRALAASRGFLAAARLSCEICVSCRPIHGPLDIMNLEFHGLWHHLLSPQSGSLGYWTCYKIPLFNT